MTGNPAAFATIRIWTPCLLGLVAATSLAAQAPSADKVAKSITRIYGPGVQVDSVRVDSTTVLRISQGGSLRGFAEVRNVKGKDQPITHLVAIDSADRLKDIDILVYREPHGGEVAYDSWRKQFRGKTISAPLQVDKDIRNISGATISSNAVTRSVRQALAELTGWHRSGRLK
jgi:Na+-translocating ferredoxin:NAD+ oxidoreductase RnfG subunit